MGTHTGQVWRSELDAEVRGHDEEIAGLAHHRKHCQRTEQRRCRAQAAKWQEHRQRELQVLELRWDLAHQCQHLSQPQDTKKVDEALAVFQGDEHDDGVDGRAGTPDDAHKRNSARARRLRTRVQIAEEGGEAVSPVGSATSDPAEAGPKDKSRQKAAISLKSSALRPKQSVKARHQRISKNRRAQKKQELVMARRPSFGKESDHFSSTDEENDEQREARDAKDRDNVLFNTQQVHGKGKRSSMIDFLKGGAHALGMSNSKKNTANDVDLEKYQVKDRKACKRVFDFYDVDGSNALDQAELRNCLAELGLRAKNTAERNEIHAVLRSVNTLEVKFEELVDRIVPQVRYRLAKLNRQRLLDLFHDADDDRSGMLSINELVKMLRAMGTYPTQGQVEEAIFEVVEDACSGLRAIDGELIVNKDVIKYEHFEQLVSVMQERVQSEHVDRARAIIAANDLTREQVELWKHDLVDLYDAFLRYCDIHSETLDSSQLINILRDVGVFPKKRGLVKTINMLIHEDMKDEDMRSFLEFGQCVRILSRLRTEEFERLQQVFEEHDVNCSGGLSLTECQRALRSCEIVPRNQDEAQEIKALIEEFDEDGSGEVDLHEFQQLVQFVIERLRRLRREAERERVFRYGWTDSQYQEFRKAFIGFDEDLSETLDRDEVVKAVHQLRHDWPPEDTLSLIGNLDIADHMSFVAFLDLMNEVDERESQRKIGYSLGLEKSEIDVFCDRWKKLSPSKEGTITRNTLEAGIVAFLTHDGSMLKTRSVRQNRADILDPKITSIDFKTFCRVMRRVEDSETGI